MTIGGKTKVPTLTVIVPAHNKTSNIERLIDAIDQQNCSATFDCIIAANACSDATVNKINNSITKIERLRKFHLLIEEKRGKSFALNAAIRVAQGELLVFCDDDCTPDRDWLEAYLQASRYFPKATLFTGQIRPEFENTPPKWLEHLCDQGLAYGCSSIGRKDGPVSFSIVKGANLAARRKKISEPYFDENLFNYGGEKSIGGEDTFFAYTQTSEVNPPIFVSRAIVHHIIKKIEINLFSFGRRQIRIGKAMANREMALGGLKKHRIRLGRMLRLSLKALFWRILGDSRKFGIQYRRFCIELGKNLQIMSVRHGAR